MVMMFIVAVDPTTWEATVVNAGHPPPLLLDPGAERPSWRDPSASRSA